MDSNKSPSESPQRYQPNSSPQQDPAMGQKQEKRCQSDLINSPICHVEDGMSVKDHPSHQAVPIPALNLSPPPENKLTSEQLDKELATFLKTKELPTTEILAQLIQHISRRRVDAIQHSDYDECDKLTHIQLMLKLEITADYANNEMHYESKAAEERLKIAKAELKEVKSLWEKRLEQLKADFEDKRKEMASKHEIEDKEFKDHWSNPNSLHEYSKPSAELIQLRSIEKKKAITGDFVGAKATKKRADKLEKQEVEEAQKRAAKGVQASFDALQERHEKEMLGLERFSQKMILSMTVRTDSAALPIEMAIKKLQQMIVAPPIPKKPNLVSKGDIAGPGEEVHESLPVSTPRTLQKLASIRAAPAATPLDIPGIPVEKILPKPKKKKVTTEAKTPRKKKESVV